RLLDLAWGPAERVDMDVSSRVSHVGYTDLIGQLRAALDQFPAVRLVPFSLVALLIAIYILLIGPLDYLLLRRWGGRFTWTWLTWSMAVIAFCGLAYGLDFWWKGDRLRV